MRALVAILVGVMGCAAARSPAPQPRSPAPPAAPAAAPERRSAGLADPSNDPEIVEAARAMLACIRSAEDPQACSAMMVWTSLRGIFDESAEATLVNMIEDSEADVRELAASTLGVMAYRPLPSELAERLIAAAERETHPTAALHMISDLARVDVEATGTFDRIHALVSRDSTPMRARAAFLSGAMGVNGGSRRMFDFVVPFVTGADSLLRWAARDAFLARPWRFPDETCALLVGFAQRDVTAESSEAARIAARSGACGGHYDALLAVVESRAAAGATRYSDHRALSWLCRDPAATDGQRVRGQTIADGAARRTRTDAFERTTALTALFVCSGASGKDKMRPFVVDPEPRVRDEAKSLRNYGLLRGCDE